MYLSDIKHSDPGLQEKLARLYSLNRGTRLELSFRRPYLDLLAALGNPHLSLPPVIHVAGTNGKGSVIAFMRSILEQAGYRAHAYTSPHLVSFNERILLGGRRISNEELESLIDEALYHNAGNEISFFEITTAIAFAAFARSRADALLLETGLGGRLDCTNVIPHPAACVITAIGYDHREYLGDTLCSIAAEKAGIMKRAVPCILAPQSAGFKNENAGEIFLQSAAALEAPLLRCGSEWFIAAEENRFILRTGTKDIPLPLPGLNGEHQIENAATACMVLHSLLGLFDVSEKAMAAGVAAARWPARLQDISSRFPEAQAAGWEIWLDGAHNGDGAKTLASQCKKWDAQDRKPTHLVLGMMRHKDPLEFMAPLAEHAASLTLTGIPDDAAAFTPAELKAVISQLFPPDRISEAAQFSHCVVAITEKQKSPARIIITGSLYLAGHVLKSLA